jgi:hypothetical protein
MLTKLLRWPVPDQIKALLEKIDNEGAALDSSSRNRIRELLDEDFLTRYEKFLLKRGLRTYKRAKALDDAMCIVLNQPDEKEAIREAYRENLIASMKTYPGALQGAMQNPYQNTVNIDHRATVNLDPRAIYDHNTASYK